MLCRYLSKEHIRLITRIFEHASGVGGIHVLRILTSLLARTAAMTG
jgi:hypothetical protein